MFDGKCPYHNKKIFSQIENVFSINKSEVIIFLYSNVIGRMLIKCRCKRYLDLVPLPNNKSVVNNCDPFFYDTTQKQWIYKTDLLLLNNTKCNCDQIIFYPEDKKVLVKPKQLIKTFVTKDSELWFSKCARCKSYINLTKSYNEICQKKNGIEK